MKSCGISIISSSRRPTGALRSMFGGPGSWLQSKLTSGPSLARCGDGVLLMLEILHGPISVHEYMYIYIYVDTYLFLLQYHNSQGARIIVVYTVMQDFYHQQ